VQGSGCADPLEDYQRSAAELYGGFLRRVRHQAVRSLYFLQIPL
jgi:hypothetical protein